MSYLTPITHTSPARASDDFQCGWSVMHMLAELSLQARKPSQPCEQDNAKSPRRSIRAAQSTSDAA